MDKAQQIIEAAIDKAKTIGQPMNVAIVDAGANLMAFMRMDGAWLAASTSPSTRPSPRRPSISRRWSLAATASRATTFFGIHVSNHGQVMIFAGGLPIKVNGQIAGAVGVSGGSGEQDQAVAEAAVAACS